MKKQLLLLISLILFTTISAQLPYIEWENTIGGDHTDLLRISINTSDGGYMLAGRSYSNISVDKTDGRVGAGNDFWILKIDYLGNIEWQKTIGGDGNDDPISMQQTSDGGYIIGGDSQSNSSIYKSEDNFGDDSQEDIWIVKLDPLGNIEWENSIGGTEYDEIGSVRQTVDGGYIIGATSNSPISVDKTEAPISPSGDDYWIIKLDGLGNITWQQTIGGSDDEELNSIEQTLDGGYIVGGYSRSDISGDKTENTNGLYDFWILKLDALGNIVWQNSIGGNGNDVDVYIQQLADGAYILAGNSQSDISGDKLEDRHGFSNDYWIIKLDALGNLGWQNTIGGTQYEKLYSLDQTDDNGYILGGDSNSPISGDKTEGPIGGMYQDYWIVKVNEFGIVEWDKTMGGTDSETRGITVQNSFGNYLISGRSSSGISGDKTETVHGSSDYWIVKLVVNRQWTGATSTDWNDATNWGGNILPTLTDHVVIPDVSGASGNFPLITSATTIGRVTVQPGATITVADGVSLSDTIFNSGDFILQDGAYLDDYTDPIGHFDGDIIVQTISANGFTEDQRYISSPVNTPDFSELADDLQGPWGAGAQGDDGVGLTVDCGTGALLLGSNYGNLFEYDESAVVTCGLEGWIVRSAGSLENARGYSAYLPTDMIFDFKGSPNTGAIAITPTNSGSGVIDTEGWNLLGNPYPSPIGRDEMLGTGATDLQYYVATGEYSGTFYPYLPTSNIAIAQGFYALYSTTTAVTIDDSFRNTGPATWYQNESWFDHKLELSVSGSNGSDRTIVYFNEEATSNHDAYYDVRKRNSSEGKPSFSSISGSDKLSLNGLSLQDVNQPIGLNLKPGNSGTFEISLEGTTSFPFNTTIYLKDLKENILHNITNASYQFMMTDVEDEDRFEIIIIPVVALNVQAVDCEGNPGLVELLSDFTLENRTYELSFNDAIISLGGLEQFNQDLNEGSYIVHVFDDFNGVQEYSFEVIALETVVAEFEFPESIYVDELINFHNSSSSANHYEWQIDGNQLLDIVHPSHTFTSEGTFEVSLTASNDECIKTTTRNISVQPKITSVTSGVEDFVSKIFPNPVYDQLNLRLNSNQDHLDVRITDLTGKVVFRLDNYGSTELNISTISFEKGMYFLNISNGFDSSTYKILKL